MNKNPLEILTEAERRWFARWLTESQVRQGIKEANSDQKFVVLQVLGAARRRVERGLPPYGDLWEKPSGGERRRFIKGLVRQQT